LAGLHSKGLFFQLSAAFFAVVAVAFAANAWLAIEAGRDPLMRLVEDNLSLGAHSVLEDVDRHLSRCARQLRSWSRLSILDDVLIDDRSMRIENLVLELERDHPEDFQGFTVLDRDERVVASTDVGRIGGTLPLGELDLRPEPEGSLWFGRYPVNGEGEAVFVLAHPIVSRLHTDSIGWFVAYVNWQPIERILARAEIGGQKQDTGRFLILVDRANNTLAADADLLAAIPAIAELPGRRRPDGISSEPISGVGDFLVARHGAPAEMCAIGRDLRIIASWKRSEAHRVVRYYALVVAGSALFGLALAGAAAFLVARRLAGRIGTLTQGTQSLARGNLTYRVEEGRDDEIGRLARSFNRMAVKLADAREEVEAVLARWHALVEHAPDIIMTVTREGTILSINRTVAPYTAAEVKGTSMFSFIPQRFHETVRKALASVFVEGVSSGYELEGAGPGGTQAWYVCRVSPIMIDGRVDAATIIATDMTEHRRLEREILEVSETERERLGQELHDGVGQVLTGTALLSKGLQTRLSAKSPGDASDARQIAELINKAIQHTRDLAHGLFPVGLERSGLVGALEELATSVDGLPQVSCRVEGAPGFATADRSRSLHLFRITQEALSNALRHGKARNIVIRFVDADGRHGLSVLDDGVGIADDRRRGSGMGLRLMEYRANVIGASLRVERRSEGGTAVICWF